MVGSGGTVSCSIDPLAVGSAVFTVTVGVDLAIGNGTILSNTAMASSATADPDGAGPSATATTTVSRPPTAVTLGSFSTAPDRTAQVIGGVMVTAILVMGILFFWGGRARRFPGSRRGKRKPETRNWRADCKNRGISVFCPRRGRAPGGGGCS